MHSQRPQPDRPTATSEPMRAEDVHRMLAARQEQPQPRRHSLRRRLGILVTLFALYVLSIGPLYWKWYGAKVGLGSPLYLILYRPLEKLSSWIPEVGHFLNWYISLWIY